MKKILLLFLLAALITPATIFAGTVRFGGDHSLRKGEEVKDDFYIAGNNTTVAGNIIGDLLAAGLNVFVGGNTVTEDAVVIGANINVISDIKGDLRILGGKVYFGGSVGEDLSVVSQEIQTLPQSIIEGNLLAGTGRVVLNGEIRGDVQITAGEVFLNDKIGGDASITANRVVLGPNAVITGSLNYASKRIAEISDGAKIIGATTYRAIDTRPSLEKFLPTLWGTWVLIRFVMLFLGGLILHGVFRTISQRFVSTTVHHFMWSILRGFVFVVAVPIAILLVFLTFVGIPFGLLGIALYTVFIILALIYGSIVSGSVLYRLVKMEEGIVVNWKTILVGAIFTTTLTLVPYAGPLVTYGLMLAALGGIYQVLFDKFVEVR